MLELDLSKTIDINLSFKKGVGIGEFAALLKEAGDEFDSLDPDLLLKNLTVSSEGSKIKLILNLSSQVESDPPLTSPEPEFQAVSQPEVANSKKKPLNVVCFNEGEEHVLNSCRDRGCKSPVVVNDASKSWKDEGVQ